MIEETLTQKVERLEKENRLLRKTLDERKRMYEGTGKDAELRRLRQKIAEWEGSMSRINGGYYHGDRFIKPFIDQDEDD